MPPDWLASSVARNQMPAAMVRHANTCDTGDCREYQWSTVESWLVAPSRTTAVAGAKTAVGTRAVRKNRLSKRPVVCPMMSGIITPSPPPDSHDRARHRWTHPDRPFRSAGPYTGKTANPREPVETL